MTSAASATIAAAMLVAVALLRARTFRAPGPPSYSCKPGSEPFEVAPEVLPQLRCGPVAPRRLLPQGGQDDRVEIRRNGASRRAKVDGALAADQDCGKRESRLDIACRDALCAPEHRTRFLRLLLRDPGPRSPPACGRPRDTAGGLSAARRARRRANRRRSPFAIGSPRTCSGLAYSGVIGRRGCGSVGVSPGSRGRQQLRDAEVEQLRRRRRRVTRMLPGLMSRWTIRCWCA